MAEPHPETLATADLGAEVIRLDRLAASLAERLEAVRARQALCETFMLARVRELPAFPYPRSIQVGHFAFRAEGTHLAWSELVAPAEPIPRPEAPEEFDEP